MATIDEQFDAVVIGAGITGGVMAAQLSRRGFKTLLVEKSTWPRETVCGGCLNAAAIEALRQADLADIVLDADVTHKVIWRAGGQAFEHPIPSGAAVLRRAIDAAVVQRAIERGCTFLAKTSAVIQPDSSREVQRVVRLKSGNDIRYVTAKFVVAADGIGGTSLATEPWSGWSIASGSFMGVAVTCESDEPATSPNAVHMYIGEGGYVGLVRVSARCEHLAAALDPIVCQEVGGPTKLIERILRHCGRDVPGGFAKANLIGKGRLTRLRRRLGGHRVLAIGDACGYVEPVTGEGMAWGLVGAVAVAELLPVDGSWQADLPRRWEQLHRRIIGKRQRLCHAMRWFAHHPRVARGVISLSKHLPRLSAAFVSTICPSPKQEHARDHSVQFGITKDCTEARPRPAGHRHGHPGGLPAGDFAGTGPHAGAI